LALGLAHTDTHLRALTVTMAIILTLARPTAITERIGSLAGCLSELVHGSVASADEARSSAIAALADRVLVDAVSVDLDLVIVPASLVADPLLRDVADSIAAGVSPAARLAAGSEAALADSTAAEVSTVVAVPTGVDTGNCPEVCD